LLDNLYAFERADFNRPIWARLSGTTATAATSVPASAQNMQQQPFLVSTIAVFLTGGAAQFATRGYIRIRDQAGAIYAYLHGQEFVSTTVAGFQLVSLAPSIPLVIPPLWRISGQGEFNAGANANTVEVNAMGWYIPRGTLALP
jgi:hypothetical protein